MAFKFNKKYIPIIESNCRYNHLWGGRGRGGTYFAVTYFIMMLVNAKTFRGGFMRATFGALKKGIWFAYVQQIEKRCEEGEFDLKDFAFNNSELGVVYKPNGNSIICKGFRVGDSKLTANLKGIESLTHIAIEEAEEISEHEFNKVDDTLRTTKAQIKVILLFNPPPAKHWLINNWYTL